MTMTSTAKVIRMIELMKLRTSEEMMIDNAKETYDSGEVVPRMSAIG